MEADFPKIKELVKGTIGNEFVSLFLRETGIRCLCAYYLDEKTNLINCIYREGCKREDSDIHEMHLCRILKTGSISEIRQSQYVCKCNHEKGIQKFSIIQGVSLFLFSHLEPRHPNRNTPGKTADDFFDFFRNTISGVLINEYMQRLSNCIERIEIVYSSKNRLIVPQGDGLRSFQIDMLRHVTGSGSYSTLNFYDQGDILVSKRIAWVAQKLATHPNFYRIHSSVIVNTNFMDRVIGRKYYETGGACFDISARNVVEFKKHLLSDH